MFILFFHFPAHRITKNKTKMAIVTLCVLLYKICSGLLLLIRFFSIMWLMIAFCLLWGFFIYLFKCSFFYIYDVSLFLSSDRLNDSWFVIRTQKSVPFSFSNSVFNLFFTFFPNYLEWNMYFMRLKYFFHWGILL